MSIRGLLAGIYVRVFRPSPLPHLVSRGLTVGRNLSMLEGAWIDSSHCHHITIGDDVTLSRGVRVLAHDASTKRHLSYTRIGKVDIGDRTFIGAGSIILPGVRIGRDVIVGAGSVVTRDIPDRSVAHGNPARVSGTLDDFLERKRDEMDRVPSFGEGYTERGGVTPEMRREMNERMTERVGYVV